MEVTPTSSPRLDKYFISHNGNCQIGLIVQYVIRAVPATRWPLSGPSWPALASRVGAGAGSVPVPGV